jgi:hypothetical protein
MLQPSSDFELSASIIISKALVGAADQLGLVDHQLGTIVGLSACEIASLRNREFLLTAGSKSFELSILLIRLSCALDVMSCGEALVARAWLFNENNELADRPIDAIRRIDGLVDVVAYLEHRASLQQ